MKLLRHAHILAAAFLAILPLIMMGCSSTRHVPQGKYLLDEVKIKLNDSTGLLNEQQLMTYVRNQPNHKMLWATKFRLGIYNMSGADSTKWWNRWIRNLGEAPAIYEPAGTLSDAEQLRKAMINAGFLNAEVKVDSAPNRKKRKMSVEYELNPGKPHLIRNIEYKFANDTLRQLVMKDSARFVIRPGDPLDLSLLETQRDLVTTRLRNHGYYAFGKEFIIFNADTTAGSTDVDLTMTLNPAYPTGTANTIIDTHREYIIRNIYFLMDYNPGETTDITSYQAVDTVRYKDIDILYGNKRYLRPGVLYENCFITKGAPYRLRDVNNTYAALGRLGILKFINIRCIPAVNVGALGFLDAYILLTPVKSQSF